MPDPEHEVLVERLFGHFADALAGDRRVKRDAQRIGERLKLRAGGGCLLGFGQLESVKPTRMAPSVKVAFLATQVNDRFTTRRASRWRRGPGISCCCGWSYFPLATWAGPPILPDNPQPVEFQHWQVYVASIDCKAKDGWVGDGPHVEINYGVVPNVQLHLIAPVAYDSPTARPGHYGYGDTELGVKFRFVQESK